MFKPSKEKMNVAIGIAKKGITKHQSPFGAAIFDAKGRLIAKAHNTVFADKDITAHAEINAIRKACNKLRKIKLDNCIIYSTTEPCPMCFSAIHWAGISKIVYGTTINDAANLGFSELKISNRKLKSLAKLKIKIYGPFMRKECLALFKEYARKIGKYY